MSDVWSRADFPEPRGLTDDVPKAKKESKSRLDEPEDLGTYSGKVHGVDQAAAVQAAKKRRPVPSRAGSVRGDVQITAPIEIGEMPDVRSRADFPEPRGLTDDVPKAKKESKSRLDDPEHLGYIPAAKKPRTHIGEVDTDTFLVQTVSNPIRGAPEGVKSIPPAPRLDREGRREMHSKWRKSAMYVACLLVLTGVIVGITVGVRNSRSGGDETPAPSSPSPAAPTMAPTTPNIFPTVDPFVELQEYLISVSPDGGAALQDPSTPQYAAFTWLSEELNLSTYSETQINQRYSLATLYFSTGGEDWSASNEWLGPLSECLWLGVGCEAARPTRRLRRRTEEVELVVTKVHLFELGLVGPLPPELVLMPDTFDLTFYGNTITGSIPTFIGEMSSLEVLELDGNQISGAIPLELYGLTSLTSIRLENNNLVGRIATEVGQLVALEKLCVDDNFISGSIPEEMGNMVNLKELRLNTNQFSGIVPDSIANLVRVESIYLHETSLEGSVPSSICGLIGTNLQDLTSNCGGTEPDITCECCTVCYPVEE